MILSQHNTKLGRIQSFNISTNPCKDIEVCKACYNTYCYARKIERLYPAFKAKNLRNLALTQTSNFIELISEELVFAGDYIRVHSSGEFYDQKYLDRWMMIARRFPAKTFYCYTKRYDLDFSHRPRNMVVYLSDDLLQIMGSMDIVRKFDGVTYIRFDKSVPIERGFKLCKHQTKAETQCDRCFECTKPGGRICFDKH